MFGYGYYVYSLYTTNLIPNIFSKPAVAFYMLLVCKNMSLKNKQSRYMLTFKKLAKYCHASKIHILFLNFIKLNRSLILGKKVPQNSQFIIKD